MKFDSRPPQSGSTHRPKEFTPHHNHHNQHGRQGTCIALVDSHYLTWLLKQNAAEEASLEGMQRQMLPSVLGSALKQAHLTLDIRRIYWYGETNDHQYPNDQVARWMGTEGSEEVFHALSADIRRLAERQACDHLLIASDDERLRAVMDEAQLYGLSVYLLADESARHMDQLEQEDPAWCQLLAQADRRVFLHPMALKDLTQVRTPHVATAANLDQSRAKMQEVVDMWWDEEPEDLREDLRDDLAGTQGIPQDVDRHLLLRVRRVLDRPLNFAEKKLLREIVRSKVLGGPAVAESED